MEHFTLQAPKHNLYGVKWTCPDAVAAICLIHGMGEYAERYDTTARYFVENGFEVYGIDLWGHGHSGGPRGYIGGTGTVLSDIEALVGYAREHSPGRPIFYFGHSMGSNLGLALRMYRPSCGISAYVLSSPWLVLRNPPSVGKLFMLKCCALFVPSSKLNVGKRFSKEKKLKNVAEDYIRDPLIHPFITPKVFATRLRDCKLILKNAHFPGPPVFMIHGTKDTVCSIEGSRTFIKHAGSECRLFEIAGGGHETMNLRQYIDALAAAVVFMNDQMKK